ncbi:APC family permease [Weissella bombi]|uniref:Amino acid/polyamine/organocation transporter, APC superfamily n=1 Tax=Weissella bombi TaxID=1505725 RepID=A0A1C3ZR00_9LACO|nr:amino acid permease [Weissella bombi]SCB84755.1 amino acid/polyamine/organocation transporter, APC superfamily [Weissella bombi]
MGMWQRMFKKESLDTYMSSDENFEKTLNAKDLMALGIGAVIGSGIFVLPGTVAATTTGPAIIFSFILAALVSSLVAMAYSEMSTAMPVAGSAYSYGNVIFGEVIGWVLGWALILEYMLSVSAVSTGWSAYFANLISPLVKIPTALSGAFDPAHGTYINIVAVVIVLLVGLLLRGGMRQSKRVENAMVVLKLVIILAFIVIGFFFIKSSNYHPLIPERINGAFGWQGIITGTSMVFFAFLGFDALSSSAAEVKNPKRNMPIGIIGTLIVAAILYGAMGLVLTGMVHYSKLNVADPAAFALQQVGQNWASLIITIGALIGMATMMYTMTYAASRLIYAVGRDGLLPGGVGKVNKHGNPNRALAVATIVIAIFSGLVPLDKLVDLVNVGTLLAFVVVSIGILPLRHRKDVNHDGYKMPGYPVMPIVSALLSGFLITQLHAETLIAAGIWFIIGIVLYMTYGIRHSRMNK